MPKLVLPNVQTVTFTANGNWKCPPRVNFVMVESTGSGATFNTFGSIKTPYVRLFSVTQGLSYAVVVGTADVTVKFMAHRGAT